MDHNHLMLWLFGISVCFLANSTAHEAVIDGETAKEAQFPYQVGVLDPVDGLVCGGAIIAEQFVLSAAHCVLLRDGGFRGALIKIIAGTNDLRKTHMPTEIIAVKKLYVPANYSPMDPTGTGDIAIFKLEKSLKFSRHINKLGLPKIKHETHIGESGIIAGFGWDQIVLENNITRPTRLNHLLRYLQANVIDPVTLGFPDAVSKKHMFARTKQHIGKQRSLCMGDSGSALVYNHTAVGILSLSPRGCTKKQLPGIYTRVSYFLDFIHEAMNNKNSKYIRNLELIRPNT